MKKLSALAATIPLCLSCASYGDSAADIKSADAQVAAMTTCEKITALINGHDKGFPLLRTQKTNAKLLDVWKARYHLVGDSCQVWGWGKGEFSYMCSLSTPNRDTSMDYYAKAKTVAADCLGAQWQLQEGARELGEGMKALFTRSGSRTAVGVQAVATPGLFRDEWTTYFFVGSPNDAL